MDALKAKKARASARQMGVGGIDGGEGEEMFGGKVGSQWSQNKGANELLQYLGGRGMRAGLVLPSKSVKPLRQEEIDHFLEGFALDLDPVIHADKAQQLLDKNAAPFEWALRQWNLQCNKVLLVTTEAKYLEAARDVGLFSCFFTTKNARRPNIRPSHSALTLGEVRDIIEEINGISYAA